jgi:predicted permease
MLRLLLACCPAAFRETYTRDIEELFEARRARLRGRPMRLLWLWLTTAGDLFLTAGAEWRGALAGHRAGVRLENSPGRLPMTDRLMLDVRDAGRHLAAAPGFTVAAVAILALGIGSSTAIFSAVDAFALRSRPFARPTELVNIYQDSDDGRPESNSYPTYVDVSQYTDLFSGVGAVMPEGNGTLLTDSGDADFVQIEFATSSYFPVLGLQPRLGRWFTPDEDRPGAPPAAVLTHAAWQRRFGSDPGVIGRTIRVSGAAVTIIGVGPVRHNGFVAGLASDFWMSISALGPVGGAFRGATLTRRDDHWFQIVARLAPGRTAPEAQSAMNVLAERIGREFPDSDRGRKMTVMSAADVRVHPEIDAMIYPTAGLNLLLTALLLAIVCSNLANLMLARGSTRTRELAVRLAIGATRAQVIRSLVVESVLLALAGGAVGLALAWWAIGLIDNAELPLALPVKAFITLDYRVAAFAIGVSLLSGLAFGLLPAIRNSRRDLSDTLKIDSRAARGALRVADLRGLLIVVQIAISLALIACGGILLRSMLNAMRVDLGFDPRSVVAVTVDPMQAGRSAQQAMQTLLDLRERAASHPGVEFAALATRAPVTPFGPSNTIVLDEHAIHRTESGTVEVASTGVTPDYFRALRIGILYGREFTPADRTGADRVAIVSEAMARRFWGTSDVVGRRYRHGGSDTPWVTIVGVARDVPIVSPGETPRPFVYRPFAQGGFGRAALVIRGSGEPAALIAAVRQEVRTVDPLIPLMQPAPMQGHIDRSLAAPRAAARLLTALGLMAVLLACVGIYSVVAFSVARRRNEMGVRMALGATAPQVVGMVVREMAQLVAIGVAAGLALAAFIAPALRSLLIGIQPLDARTFAIVTAGVAAVALITAWLPARRAAEANPAAVLRAE